MEIYQIILSFIGGGSVGGAIVKLVIARQTGLLAYIDRLLADNKSLKDEIKSLKDEMDICDGQNFILKAALVGYGIPIPDLKHME